MIIHEGRFTYGSYGLRRLIDLGEWWEDVAGLPLPLGGIAVRRTLEEGLKAEIDGPFGRAWSTPGAIPRPRVNTCRRMLKRWIRWSASNTWICM